MSGNWTIVFLWHRDIRAERNRAFYKRMQYLGLHNRAILLTGKHQMIDPAMDQYLTACRCPWELGVATGHSTWARILRIAATALNYLLYAVWAIRWIRQTLSLQNALVYTFQTPEARIGNILRQMGYTWVLDVLDLPDLYLDNVAYESRAQGKGLTYRVLAFNYWWILRLPHILRSASIVITTAPDVEHGFARVLQDKYQVPRDKLFCVPNGIDLELVKPRGLQCDPEHFTLFYAGTVHPLKGGRTMLQALAVLAQRIPEARLVIAGVPTRGFSTEFWAMCERLEIRERISVLGWIDHMECLKAMEASDVCLYPVSDQALNYRLAYPIKLFEYLGLGRAVVASDVPATRYIIQDGQNGLLVQPDNPVALAEGVHRLYTDPGLRGKLEQTARQSVEPYDWNLINERVNQRVQNLIGQ